MQKFPATKSKRKSDDLPERFTDKERAAYDWLYDVGISPWVVDLLTKKVRTAHGSFENLVEYAKSHGMTQ